MRIHFATLFAVLAVPALAAPTPDDLSGQAPRAIPVAVGYYGKPDCTGFWVKIEMKELGKCYQAVTRYMKLLEGDAYRTLILLLD
jgi:hypothetical protein